MILETARSLPETAPYTDRKASPGKRRSSASCSTGSVSYTHLHNGQEVKAADVKASLELCKESPQVSQYGDAVESVEVIDDYTVKITTNGPHSGLLTDLSHHGNAILPADLIASGHDFNKEPIGTGPYKFVAWNKGESIELEANEDYWGEVPAIKHVIWKIIPEGSSRTCLLYTS